MKNKTQTIDSPTEVLNRAFAKKKQKQPSYSYRSVAQSLSVSASYVSALFRGLKNIPTERITDLARALDMDSSDESLLRRAIAITEISKLNVDLDLLNSQTLPSRTRTSGNIKEFSMLEPWYRMALLDLVTCSNFNDDPKWIAQKLGIRVEEAHFAFNELFRHGFIGIENGRYKKIHQHLRFPTTKSLPKIREFHKKMMEKAIYQMMNKTDDESFRNRTINGITMATNPVNIEKARLRLREVLFEIADILSDGECTEVYQLNFQLFPLTSNEEK
ncbi:MAG: TIGR02147 family protein [Pseudobdellovibrionaceae bacterium]